MVDPDFKLERFLSNEKNPDVLALNRRVPLFVLKIAHSKMADFGGFWAITLQGRIWA